MTCVEYANFSSPHKHHLDRLLVPAVLVASCRDSVAIALALRRAQESLGQDDPCYAFFEFELVGPGVLHVHHLAHGRVTIVILRDSDLLTIRLRALLGTGLFLSASLPRRQAGAENSGLTPPDEGGTDIARGTNWRRLASDFDGELSRTARIPHEGIGAYNPAAV